MCLRKTGQHVLPDRNHEAVCLHLGGRNDIPAEPYAIPILDFGPAILELIVLCLIHVGGR